MKKEEIITLAKEALPYAVSARKRLHETPEVGNHEFRTTEFLVSELEKMGYEVLRPLETGAVAVMKMGEGKTVAIRADIDALPVTEETDLPFSSKNPGFMHACGHDVHTASLLAAAKAVSENKDRLPGTVKLLFQPDEEGSGGADRLLKAGMFENPTVDAVFGIHVLPELPAGTVAVRYSKSYASSDVFEIRVIGKSTHGAQPENGKNPIPCASEIALSLESLVGRTIAPTESAVLSVCTFKSGTACNIIPPYAELSGTIRTLDPETRVLMKKKLCAVCEAVAESRECKAEVTLHESYPSVINHDEETALVEKTARAYFPDEKVLVLRTPTMTTEDFGYYLHNTPGCFYHIGAGSEYPLHNSRFVPDEKALESALCMHLAVINEYLG